MDEINPIQALEEAKANFAFLEPDQHAELCKQIDQMKSELLAAGDEFTKTQARIREDNEREVARLEAIEGLDEETRAKIQQLKAIPDQIVFPNLSETPDNWMEPHRFDRFGFQVVDSNELAHWTPADPLAFSDWAMESISLSAKEDPTLDDKISDDLTDDYPAAGVKQKPAPTPPAKKPESPTPAGSPEDPSKPKKPQDDEFGWGTWLDGEVSKG